MDILRYIVTAITGYIMGSVSFSILISKLFHKTDIRDCGSGNAGATNMARAYGLSAGLNTMIGDMFKTGLAILNGYFILGRIGICIAALFCLLGHCFPVFYDFRGGKGVSAGAVIAFAISSLLLLIILAVFLIVAFATRKVSAGSLAAALSMPLAAFFLHCGTDYFVLSAIVAVIIIIRHRANIQRLINGTEPDFSVPSTKN